jgi:hypothetical protein
MKTLFPLGSLFLFWLLLQACASKRVHQYDARSTHDREECPELHNGLSRISADPNYGYEVERPIRVGGGPNNEITYLQMLLGPQGQYLDQYFKDGYRVGVDGVTRLNQWHIVVDGDTLPKPIFLDMAHCADPQAPLGFQIKDEFKEKTE